MDSVFRPAADWEVASVLTEATANRTPIEIVGGRSKARFARPTPPSGAISTDVLRGIQSYDPAERIITVQAGCLVGDIERELSANGQMLGFEPPDMAMVFGGDVARATIGGVVATNLAGSRRVATGGIGESVIGVKAVAGSGEIMRSGGRVTRGVAGFDLTRLLTGSWGTLAALIDVSLRVQPIPDNTRTILIFGLSEEIAVEALSNALLHPLGVTGTVHLDRALAMRLPFEQLRDQQQSVTAIRLENDHATASGRVERLKGALKAYGERLELEPEYSLAFWHELRLLSVVPNNEKPLWRIATRPSKASEVVSSIKRYMSADAFFDWSGGLIWLEVAPSADAGATEIRRIIASTGGHATLVRAPEVVKASIDVFEPMHPGVELMTKRLKQVFDPAGILNPGRLYADM